MWIISYRIHSWVFALLFSLLSRHHVLPNTAVGILTMFSFAFHSFQLKCLPLQFSKHYYLVFICHSGTVSLSLIAILGTLTPCFHLPFRHHVPVSHCSFENTNTLFAFTFQALCSSLPLQLWEHWHIDYYFHLTFKHCVPLSHCSFRNTDTLFLFASQALCSSLPLQL